MRAGGTTGAVGTIGRSAHSAPLRSTCCAACATEACCQLELIASFESSNLMRQPGSSFRQVPQFKTVGRFYGQFGGILSVERGIVQNMAVCSEPYSPVRKHRPIAHFYRLPVYWTLKTECHFEHSEGASTGERDGCPAPGPAALVRRCHLQSDVSYRTPLHKQTHTHTRPPAQTHTHTPLQPRNNLPDNPSKFVLMAGLGSGAPLSCVHQHCFDRHAKSQLPRRGLRGGDLVPVRTDCLRIGRRLAGAISSRLSRTSQDCRAVRVSASAAHV